MDPGWLRLGHSALTVRFVVVNPPIVAESSTSDHIEDYQNDEHNDVDHRYLPPALLDACKDTGLARVAGVAELGLVIVPQLTVSVTDRRSSHRTIPFRLVNVCELALCWWLAATRLPPIT